MNAAGIRAARKWLGLTQAEFAEAMGLAGEADNVRRSVQRWETDGPTGPVAAATDLIMRNAELMMAGAMRTVTDAITAHGTTPSDVPLLVYRSTGDMAAADPDTARALRTARVHAAVIDQIATALMAEGIDARLVTFDPDAFAAWRRRKRLPADRSSRAAWAAMQPV